jgi:4-carboxymuconolactone decarboxylase
MSRIPYITRDKFTSAQRQVFENMTGGKRGEGRSYESWFTPEGGLRGPFNAFLYSPAIGDAAQRLGEAVRFESSIPPVLRELAILTVAAKWKAQYEWWAHAKIATREGLDADVIDSIKVGDRPDFEDPAAAVVYGFVRELIDSHQVSDHLYGEAVKLLGEAGVVELVILMGHFTIVSMLLNVCEVPVPAGEKPPFCSKNKE